MVRCIAPEPLPPLDPVELQIWCARGYSARPVQTHLGDEGVVMWANEDRTVAIAFGDGDERLLYPEEIELLPCAPILDGR